MITLKEFRNRTQSLPEETGIHIWVSGSTGQIGGECSMMDCVGEGEDPWVVELYHEAAKDRHAEYPVSAKPATGKQRFEHVILASGDVIRDVPTFENDGWEICGIHGDPVSGFWIAWKRPVA